jgi:large subunit ribosomal protein L1
MSGKRLKAQMEKFQRGKPYALDEALKILKSTASAKFDESVDVAVNLGIDAKKSDQNVRGTAVMPRGTGKTVRVAVFADGAMADKARAAGADIVGFQDLADQIKGGNINFDLVIATPDAMKIVGQLGQILGPRGLMPNPKLGTVTFDVAKAVKDIKAGKVEYKTEKAGVIHVPIGKVSFDAQKLLDNAKVIIDSVNRAKPSTSKGKYLKAISISSTMGPGVKIDVATVSTK